MDRATEFFDSWLRSQEKAMETWEETSRKLEQVLAMQAFPGHAETATMSGEVSGREFSRLNNAWLKAMGSSLSFSDSWLKAMGVWTETAAQFQHSLLDQGGKKEAPEEGPTTEPPGLLNEWAEVLSSSVRRGSPDVVRNTALRLFSSSHAYAQLAEACLPLFSAIRKEPSDFSSYEELIDPRKYKEVLDGLFGVGPGGATEVSAKAARLLDALGFAEGYKASWADTLWRNAKTSPALFGGALEPIVNAMNDMFRTFESSSHTLFAAVTAEKDRERSALLMALCAGVSAYMSAMTRYQRDIYATGLKAIEGVIEAVGERNGKGNEIKSFDDFFSLWLEVSEKCYQGFFATEEFSKLHGELLDGALKVRVVSFKLTELYFADTPFVLRSETDDLYRTMYDLKKEVRALKKERQEVVEK